MGWATFENYISNAHFCTRYLFPFYRIYINFDKRGLGYISANFSQTHLVTLIVSQDILKGKPTALADL
jgi:hypothetical protein